MNKVFCSVPTSQLLSTDSGVTIRVALADKSSALSGMEESAPACKKILTKQNRRLWNRQQYKMAHSQKLNLLLAAVSFLSLFLFLNDVSDDEPPSAAAKSRSSRNADDSREKKNKQTKKIQ